MSRTKIDSIQILLLNLLILASSTLPFFPPAALSDPLQENQLTTSDNLELSQLDYNELFEKVFGHEPLLPDNLLVPFFISSRQYGKIVVHPAQESKGTRVSGETILDQLMPFVKAPVLEELRSKIDADKTLMISTLNALGFTADFDANNLIFQIKIPPHHRTLQTLGQDLKRLPANIEYAIKPNEATGFINFRGGYNYFHDGIGSENRYHATVLNFDAAFNYKGFVTEGISEYTDDSAWRRRDIRFIYDQPEHMLRYSGGDLHIPVQGFQTAPAVGGIGISKEFSLQPYALTRPISTKELFVARPSTIEIYVNDVLTEMHQVQPGPYNFFQTALSQGANNVRILIRDDTGMETWVDIDGYYNVSGLKKGFSQYSFNAGFLREEESSHYRYDTQKPLVSLFYRYGLSDFLTFGSYFQALPDHALLGAENSWSSFLGNINTNIAVSSNPQSDIDTAIQVLYFYRDNKPNTNPYNRSWQASFDYTGQNFSRLMESKPDNSIPYMITGSISQDLFPTLYGSLSASYGWARPESDREDNYIFSCSLTKRLSSKARMSMVLSNRKESSGGEHEWRAFLRFTFNFPQSGNSITSTLDSRDDALGINWQYSSPDNRITSMLTASTSETTEASFSERIQYRGYRGDAAVTHMHETQRNDLRRNNTNITLNSSLLYADGYFGWARIVNNSFSLLKANETLKNYTIGINKNSDGSFQGEADGFGPAAITTLSPYQVYDLQVEIPQLPIGYEVNAFNHTLLPSYKSGFLINVAGKASGLVRGTLVDEEDRPVSYVTGEAVPLKSSSELPRGFFTNKNGTFTIYGLSPGKHELRIKSKQYLPIEVIIPDTCKSNYCKLGRIQVKKIQDNGIVSNGAGKNHEQDD